MTNHLDKTIGYDLKAPCSDCPFRKDAPLHKGVLKSLPDYAERIKEGRFSHSCHKTDERADSGFASLVNGKVQHCFGSLVLMKNIEESQDENDPEFVAQAGLLYAIVGGVDYNEIKSEEVYKSIPEMVRAYKPMIEELEKERESLKGIRLSYRNRDGKRETHVF